MTASENIECLLRGILQTYGRVAFPEDQLLNIIGRSSKNLNAYQCCDGETVQADIVKKANISKGQLSAFISRCADAGIVIKVKNSEGNESPLHIYPIPKDTLRKARKKK